jgi:hypothetical protein
MSVTFHALELSHEISLQYCNNVAYKISLKIKLYNIAIVLGVNEIKHIVFYKHVHFISENNFSTHLNWTSL